jgi:polar amino acid transport system substrate-binding protein
MKHIALLLRRLVLSLLLMSTPFYAYADVISIRADAWCPYNCEVNAKKSGYGIEIIKQIFEAAGHTVDYQILNWQRSIEETRTGKYVAILGARKEDAPDFIFPNEALGLSINSFATLKDSNFRYNGINSLSGHVLGVIQSYSYSDGVDSYIKKNKLDKTRIDYASGDDALDKNINKLLANRIDVIVDDSSVLIYKLNQLGASSKIKLDKDALDPTKIYLAFSPKNPKAKEYAALFDKGIAELRAAGKLAPILMRYGLTDWQ